MTPLRQVPRLLRIAATLMRYRLDDVVEAAHLFRPLKVLRPLLPRPRADIAQLRAALPAHGDRVLELFVSSARSSRRPTCCPRTSCGRVVGMQDQVPPFPGAQARARSKPRSARRLRRCTRLRRNAVGLGLDRAGARRATAPCATPWSGVLRPAFTRASARHRPAARTGELAAQRVGIRPRTRSVRATSSRKSKPPCRTSLTATRRRERQPVAPKLRSERDLVVPSTGRTP